ncbi:hypothetical protein [Absidia glauca]|uniref:CRIB domain-containing protein n=1 Tax=Absidia glauca TaxID=4829 RepID=A0A163KBS8_ABSGL|nr:hypothetical protein [Absidia glauca]
MAGLSFSNEEDASVFFSKVTTREKEKPAKKKKAKETSGKKPTRGKLNKTQIGLPSEFRHLGHIGYTPEKGFSVQNTDSEWNGVFDQLQSLGISEREINENQDFIKDFVNQRAPPGNGLPPAASPASGRGALLDSIRNAGGIGALKKTPKEVQRDRSGASSASSMAAGAGLGAAAGTMGSPSGGDDLTSSLFNALQNRKKSVLADDDDDQDDEDSDGSEWE